MARSLRLILASAAAALAVTGSAQAAGGNYGFDGGTPKQHAQIKAALDASAFDWSIVPAHITIHVAPGTGSYAMPGHIWIDADLLSAGRFAWATVQDEYGHQVDFFLLDAAKRETLRRALGAKDWCYGVQGLLHGEYGCERFSSTLVWSYWQSADNAYRPTAKGDESGAMAPAAFRALLGTMIGAPDRTAVVRTTSAVKKRK
ncbi:MAG TPA: hypothetical protein VML35_03370 [Gaiellaceae bacterium]|nr:hypothetical protein [Gaiellaceae bacterium]